MTNSLSLLKSRRFLPLFLTQFFGAFNDNLLRTALATLVTYQMTTLSEGSKSTLVTLALGIFILPFFLFSATAGQLADKWDKARLIRYIKSAELIIITLAIVGFRLESIPLLLFVLFLMGTHSSFFGPVKYSILPNHLNEKELIGGNGLVEAGTFLAILLGTIFGGIAHLNGSGSSLFLLGGLFCISLSGLIASCFIPSTPVSATTQPLSLNILRSTLAIINASRENHRIFLAILGISWFWLVGGIFLSQMPYFTKDVLHASQGVFTLLLTMFSLGIGLGSILCNLLLKGEISNKYVPVSALVMTVFIWDIATTSASFPTSNDPHTVAQFFSLLQGWHVMADLLLFSFTGGIYIVPLYAFIQARSDVAKRSQIIAANNIINSLFMVISSVVTVLLLKIGVSIPGLFLIVAILNAGVGLYICKLLPETLIKSFFRRLFLLCFRVEVKGLEHYNACTPRTLIIANHTSFLDAALIATFLPEKVAFAVNTHISRNLLFKPFLSLVRAIAVDPTNPMATKTLIEEVKKEQKLVIFPEGRLTQTGSLMKIYTGPAMIADKTGADILPIRIDGAAFSFFSRLKRTHRLRLFPKITLTVLPPRKLSLPDALAGQARRAAAGGQLYDIMSSMMFEGSSINQTLFDALLEAKELYGACHPIVNDITLKPLTYAQFIKRAFLLGSLIKNQTMPEEKTGVLLPNMIGTAVVFFAMQATGRIPAMLNFSAGIQNVRLACKLAGIKNIYTAHNFIQTAGLGAMITALQEDGVSIRYLEDLKKKIGVIGLLKATLGSMFPHSYYAALNHHNKHLNDANKPAVILFTSGSEGTPKGVVLSHRNLQANRQQLVSRIDFNPSDKVFNALPMFHSFGLMGGTLLPILSGVQIFLYPSPLHYRIIPELIYDTNATILFGTDTFLAGYAKAAHAYDFHSVRYVFAGAEKLKDATRRLWADKFGVRIFEGYGATETSPVIAVNTPMHNKTGTVGRLMPGITSRLEPIPGIEEGGRLWVKGTNIMLGYLLAGAEEKITPPEEGWYDTGDIVTIDDKGYVTICGRAKRFAKIGGEMVSLTAVEGWINALWPDYIHAVVTIADEKKGEQLVLLTNNQEASREALVAYAKANGINELSIPRQVKTVEKLPLLGTGKVDYVAVKALVE